MWSCNEHHDEIETELRREFLPSTVAPSEHAWDRPSTGNVGETQSCSCGLMRQRARDGIGWLYAEHDQASLEHDFGDAEYRLCTRKS